MANRFLADGGFDKNDVPRAALYDSEGRKIVTRDVEVIKVEFTSSYDEGRGKLNVVDDIMYRSLVYNISKFTEIDIYVRSAVKNGIRVWFTVGLEEGEPTRAVRFFDWNKEEYVNHIEGQNDFVLSNHPNAIHALSTHPDFYWVKNNLGRLEVRVKPYNFDVNGEVEIWIVGRY